MGFLALPEVEAEGLDEGCVTELVVGVEVGPCRVVEVIVADTADALWWTLLRYRRSAVVRYEEFTDSLDLDEVLLVGVDPDRGRALPIWHTVEDRRFELVREIRWQRKRRAFLVGVQLCLNGTGGCGEVYLVSREGHHWGLVDQAFLQELAERAPDGYRLHKGRRLDLADFTGEQPLAHEDDPNCCPSGLMRFRVWLDGRVLKLVSAEVVRP